MNKEEIDEAIDNHPSGSDLEIALAIGCEEKEVKQRRTMMTREREAKAKVEARAKEDAEKKAARLEAKRLKFAEAQPITPPEPAVTEMGLAPKRQRYYLRDPESNSMVELVRMNDNRATVIFETVES